MEIEKSKATIVREFANTGNMLEDDRDLLEELGRRVKLFEIEPALANQFALPSEPPAEGVGSFFGELGRNVFEQCHRELYSLLCGRSSDSISDRERLLQAFGLDENAVITVLVSVMTDSLGIAPALAAIVAAILLRRFLKPAYETTCDLWKAHLYCTQGTDR